MAQMKDAATKVFNREKTTALSELFTIELKFTIDTLVNWFNSVINRNFLELNDFQKRAFIEKNPLNLSKTTCCICGFMLSFSLRKGPERTLNLMTWLGFIVQQGYLFIKNIYSQEYIENTDNLKTLEDFYGSFEYCLEVVTLLKNENFRSPDINKTGKLKDFFEMYCEDCNDSEDIIELINEFKKVHKMKEETPKIKIQSSIS